MEHLPKWKKMGKSFGNWRETWEIQEDEEDRKKNIKGIYQMYQLLEVLWSGINGW